MENFVSYFKKQINQYKQIKFHQSIEDLDIGDIVIFWCHNDFPNILEITSIVNENGKDLFLAGSLGENDTYFFDSKTGRQIQHGIVLNPPFIEPIKSQEELDKLIDEATRIELMLYISNIKKYNMLLSTQDLIDIYNYINEKLNNGKDTNRY